MIFMKQYLISLLISYQQRHKIELFFSIYIANRKIKMSIDIIPPEILEMICDYAIHCKPNIVYNICVLMRVSRAFNAAIEVHPMRKIIYKISQINDIGVAKKYDGILANTRMLFNKRYNKLTDDIYRDKILNLLRIVGVDEGLVGIKFNSGIGPIVKTIIRYSEFVIYIESKRIYMAVAGPNGKYDKRINIHPSMEINIEISFPWINKMGYYAYEDLLKLSLKCYSSRKRGT